MCNNLRTNTWFYNPVTIHKIPESGYGYKIFIKEKIGKKWVLTTAFKGSKVKRRTWKKWRSNYEGNGFCFLPNKTAIKNIIDMHFFIFSEKYVIVKIEYKKGLGKRMESNKYMSALCKEYQIIKEVKLKDL